MARKIVECVPNFSEGRDPAKIKEITNAIVSAPGVTLLDVDPGADTHRTVATFIGDPDAVEKGSDKHPERFSDFGEITILPLRDPMTLESE